MGQNDETSSYFLLLKDSWSLSTSLPQYLKTSIKLTLFIWKIGRKLSYDVWLKLDNLCSVFDSSFFHSRLKAIHPWHWVFVSFLIHFPLSEGLSQILSIAWLTFLSVRHRFYECPLCRVLRDLLVMWFDDWRTLLEWDLFWKFLMIFILEELVLIFSLLFHLPQSWSYLNASGTS